MRDFVTPGVYAALLWWCTTGIILFLDRLHPSTFKRSMTGGVVVLLFAIAALWLSARDVTASGAYIAFTAALLVWGCLEMSFLLGLVTGPRRHACARPCTGWRHFLHATQAIIYNELATVAGFAAIAAVSVHAPNQVGLWTYGLLWIMRLSAKLNLFLGVPNVGDQFLPAHLEYLGSFFNKRRMNWLFPLSLSAAGYAMTLLLRLCNGAESSFQIAASGLLATLLGLAILEHVFMVLPLPIDRLWQWPMGARAPAAPRLRNRGSH